MRDFPVDLIKIDKSYTSKIGEDEDIAALVAGVIHLACSLGLEVVAEGWRRRSNSNCCAQWVAISLKGTCWDYL
jgi:EAL domain-containing protein (putative c-di-GMP-specific phosphodiesterase class I)